MRCARLQDCKNERLAARASRDRPLAFDPAPRDLRMNRPVGRFTKSTESSEGRCGYPPLTPFDAAASLLVALREQRR